MKKYPALILIAIFCFLISYSYSQNNIAVLQLDNKGLSETIAGILTDRLRIELFQAGKYTVLEREKVDEILNEQGFQLSGCTSTECIVEVGKLVGVEQMVGGSVSKLGNLYSITARLISVETGKIINTAVYDHDGELEDLLKYGINKVALELCDMKQLELKNDNRVEKYKNIEVSNYDKYNYEKRKYIYGMMGFGRSYYLGKFITYGISYNQYLNSNLFWGLDISGGDSNKDEDIVGYDEIDKQYIVSYFIILGVTKSNFILEGGLGLLNGHTEKPKGSENMYEFGALSAVGYNINISPKFQIKPLVKYYLGESKSTLHWYLSLNIGYKF